MWRHTKKCAPSSSSASSSVVVEPVDHELVLRLVQQNGELMEMLKHHHQAPGVSAVFHNTTTHNTTTNIHAVNMQVFLNETCANAMNLDEFVHSIRLQLDHLEHVCAVGYVEGISHLINSNLRELDVTERPIHCADKKQDAIYVKDDNCWTREPRDKPRLKHMIEQLTDRHRQLLPQYRDKYGGCQHMASRYAPQYNKLLAELVRPDAIACCHPHASGRTSDEDEIIRKVVDAVTL